MLLVNNSNYGGSAYYDNYMKPIGMVVTSQAEMGPLYGHEVFFFIDLTTKQCDIYECFCYFAC